MPKKKDVLINFNIEGIKKAVTDMQELSKSQGSFGRGVKTLIVDLSEVLRKVESNKTYSVSLLNEIGHSFQQIAKQSQKFEEQVRSGNIKSFEELNEAINRINGSLGGHQTALKGLQDNFKQISVAGKKAFKEVEIEFRKFGNLYTQTLAESGGDPKTAFSKLKTITKTKAETKEEKAEVKEARQILALYNATMKEHNNKQKEATRLIKDKTKAIKEQKEERKKLTDQLKAGEYYTGAPVSISSTADLAKGQATEASLGAEQLRQAGGGEAMRADVKGPEGVFKKAAVAVFLYQTAVNAMRRAISASIRTVQDMDRAITQMTIATARSRAEIEEYISDMQRIAGATYTAMTEIAGLVTGYIKQGRAMADALVLAEATARAAKISSLSTTEALEFMTTAVNGFTLSAKDASRVSDIWATLAAASATDFSKLAIAISKVAAQANSAGMSIEFTSGILAKMLETTQEAPESIGTALKTVLARMRELSDFGKTLEDGMDVNAVERALKAVNISLRDTNGQFRDMESIFNEVGKAWDTYNVNQQQAIAQSMAGTRQQSRLLSIFQDYNRTLELTNKAQNSTGATIFQLQQYAKGMEAQLALIKNSWEQLIRALVESEFVIGMFKFIAGSLETIAMALEKFGGAAPIFIASLIVIGLLLKNHYKTMKQMTREGIKQEALTVKQFFTNIANLFTRKSQIPVEKAITLEKTKQAALTMVTLGWILLAVAALALIIFAVVSWLDTSKKQAEMNKKIEESLAKTHELQRRIGEDTQALENYKKLFNQIVKTNEELEKMLSLEKELQDEYKTKLTGLMLVQAVQEKLNEAEKELREEQAKGMRSTAEKLSARGGVYTDEAGAMMRQQFGFSLEDLVKAGKITQEVADEAMNMNVSFSQMTKNFKGTGEQLTASVNKRVNEFVDYLNKLNKSLEDVSEEDKIRIRYQNFIEATTLSGYSNEVIQAIKESNRLFNFLRESQTDAISVLQQIQDKNLSTLGFEQLFLTTQDIFTNIENEAERKQAISDFYDSVVTAITKEGLTKSEQFGEALRIINNSFENQADKNNLSMNLNQIFGIKEDLDFSQYIISLENIRQSERDLITKLKKGDLLSTEDFTRISNMEGITPAAIAAYQAGNSSLLIKEFIDSSGKIAAENIKDLKTQTEFLKETLDIRKEEGATQEDIDIILNSIAVQEAMIAQYEIGRIPITKELLNLNKQIAEAKDKSAEPEIRLNNALEAGVSLMKKQNKAKQELLDLYNGEVKFIDGKVLPLTDAINETQKALIDTAIESYEQATSQMKEMVDVIIDVRKEQLKTEEDALKETLDARRKLYDKYFDAIQKRDTIEDYDAQRRTILNAISRLSTATDVESLRRLKDYQQQLSELNKSQLADERSFRRDAINEQFDRIGEEMDKRYRELEEQIGNIWNVFLQKGVEAFAQIGEHIGMDWIVPEVSSSSVATDPFVGSNTDNSQTTDNNINLTFNNTISDKFTADYFTVEMEKTLNKFFGKHLNFRGINTNAVR